MAPTHRRTRWIALFILICTTLVGAGPPTIAQESKPVNSTCNVPTGPNTASAQTAGLIPIVDQGWSTNSVTADCARGWGADEWQLTLTQPKSVRIAISDCCCPGDFYELYINNVRIGTTPRPAVWGCNVSGAPSSGVFNMVLAAGQYRIKVRDAGFDGHSAQEIAYARMCPAGFTITGTLSSPPAVPDLAILPASIDFGNSQWPYPPDQQSIKATVKNIGSTLASNVLVRFFRGNPDRGGTQIGGDQTLGGLYAGTQAEASVLWPLSGNVDKADIYARAYAIGQSDNNSANNTASKTVSIYYVPFRHDQDAYSFANWSLEWADIVNDLRAFVDLNRLDNLSNAWTYGVIFPLASAVIEAGGHCYGMASTSILYQEYPQIKSIPKQTYELTQDEARTDIQTYHRQQLDHVLEAAMMKTFGFDAPKEYDNVLKSIRDAHQPTMLLMYAPEGGHAVVAYKILDLGNEKRIYLYDNNLPLSSMNDSIYATVNTQARTFTYQTSYGYTFTRFLARPAQLTWSDDAKVILKQFYDWALREVLHSGLTRVFVGSPVDPLVTDQYGRRIGLENGLTLNEIPGAQLSTLGDKKVFDLPRDLSYTMTITGTDSGTMTLSFLMPIGPSLIRGVGYDAVPVAAGSTSYVQLSTTNTDWTLTTGDQTQQPDVLQDIPIRGDTYLPMATRVSSCSSQAIVNPGFEAGPSAGWARSSAQGRQLIYSGGFPWPVYPHGGYSAGWLGQSNNEVSSLSQTFNLPATASAATLSYWYWIDSGESSCSYDIGWVELNGGLLRLHSLCTDGNTYGWVHELVDLTPYLGTTATLRFRVDTDGSIPSNFYVDDVSVNVACGN
ncbi:MAG: hypothetical protein IPO81_27050 [Kouleothrix sp.]|nr:hypothetical protein [Kouleothrix sp.]